MSNSTAMKKIFLLLLPLIGLIYSCNTPKNVAQSDDRPTLATNDTIKIANEEAEFEVIIIDPEFNGWFNINARPRSFYTQNYLEDRNRVWVSEWNNRAVQPSRYGDIYDFPINYFPNTDYGFEVNYMIFHYLTYFQLKYKQRLGGFVARI